MWIEIFKAGLHVDSKGNERNFDAEMLDKISAKYNQMVELDRHSESPIVKGHPKNDSPAVGWINKLCRRGEKLLGKAQFVTDKVLDELKSGVFKNVSVSLGADLELRHVALLGAANPAVKGLDTLKYSDFSENDEHETVIEDAPNDNEAAQTEPNARIKRIQEMAIELTPAQEAMVVELSEKFTDKSNNGDEFFGILERIITSMLDKSLISEFAIGFERTPANKNFSHTTVNPDRLTTHISAERLSQNDNISYEDALNIIYFQNQ
ncbi:MAG: hypothetical protein CVV22_10275 [Ignavibacteriae bacterium HGW-Ignavibacteriae-1]|jgi:hypothetical protein|nr:MAG: hypothetical protein CVV22_10275 [Ignavibacteriae bacterium HGW-Ignavibacteriae-1]